MSQASWQYPTSCPNCGADWTKRNSCSQWGTVACQWGGNVSPDGEVWVDDGEDVHVQWDATEVDSITCESCDYSRDIPTSLIIPDTAWQKVMPGFYSTTVKINGVLFYATATAVVHEEDGGLQVAAEPDLREDFERLMDAHELGTKAQVITVDGQDCVLFIGPSNA